MMRFSVAAFVLSIGLIFAGSLRADEQDVKAILEKAMKALGGEDKLAKVKAVNFKAKGTITFNGNDNDVSTETTVMGLQQRRAEFEGDFNGNRFKGITVINNDKGWRKFGDMASDLDAGALANEKRGIYLQLVPMTIVPLKGEGFKVESAGEEKVGDKPAVALKVTAPDGKDFKLWFDKESGLPVKLVARVMGFQGQESTQETTLSDYQESDGIKRAGKVEVKRDGQPFVSQQVTTFKVLDKVDPKTFEQPE
jgi:outer membrane lipoprotein-sorting protein